MGCNWDSRVCKLSSQIQNNIAPVSNNLYFQQRLSLACCKAKFSLFILTSFTFRGSWYETRIVTCRSDRCGVFYKTKFTYSIYHIPYGGVQHILCCFFFFILSSSCVLCTQCCQFLWIVCVSVLLFRCVEFPVRVRVRFRVRVSMEKIT